MVIPRADTTGQSVAASPRRKRFRLQYSLRTLLLLVTVLALLLSLEAKRAHDQGELVREVGDLAGTCRRAPRRWVPKGLRRLFGDNHGSTVEQVNFGGMAAGSPVGFTTSRGRLKVTDLAKLRSVLSLPAMTQVRSLTLLGTAVSDELIDDLSALPKLESLSFETTAVSEEGAERLRQALPECHVFYSSMNGPRIVATFHRDKMRLTDDLPVFRRAEAGETEAVETLMRLAGERDRDAATAAVESLSRIEDPKAMAILAEGLNSDNPRLRRAVVEALGLQYDPRQLAKAIEDPNVDVRLEAVHGMAMLGRSRILELLAKTIDDPDVGVRLEAVHGMAMLGGPRTLEPLRRALEDQSPEVRGASVRALSEIKDPAVVDLLIGTVKDADADVRWQAVHCLRRLQDGRAVEVLIGALKDEASIVRSAAAAALGEIPDSRAIEPLKAAAQDEDSFVRKHARAALQKLHDSLGKRR